MKYIRNLFILTVAILGLSQIDASAQGFSQKNIERKIYKEIITLPFYGVFDNIKFQVDGDTVYLTGKVVRPTTKSSAENVVEDIEGVREVVNDIEVLPLSSFDDRIRLQTLRTLQSRGGSLYRYFLGASPSVRILVDNGHVTLEGFVATRGDKNLANVLVNGIPGVFSVTNNLVVEKELLR